MAITYAAHALGLSIPFAGAELDVVYSYRQFRRAGLDAATTSWSRAVSWICSTASLALLLVAGALRFDRMRALLVLLGGWVAFIVLAHPPRRRRGQ
jgi:hypothetical protein